MFTTWMEKNKKDPNVRKLTNLDFLLLYVYKENIQKWVKWKSRFSIEGTNFVLPSASELFYLHMLLSKVKGLTCYKDMCALNGVIFETF